MKKILSIIFLFSLTYTQADDFIFVTLKAINSKGGKVPALFQVIDHDKNLIFEPKSRGTCKIKINKNNDLQLRVIHCDTQYIKLVRVYKNHMKIIIMNDNCYVESNNVPNRNL